MNTRILTISAVLVLLVACGSQPQNASRGAAAVEPAEEHEVRVVKLEPVLDEQASGTAAEVAVTGGYTLAQQDMARAPASPALRAAYRAPSYQDYGRENYQQFENNGVHVTAVAPVSTFSIDVDTASYANVRRILNHGQLPQPDAVRVEELVNYFSYDYPRARGDDAPFSVYTEMGPSPWDTSRRLLHVGINGWQPDADASLPPANLVFLIDVSGSMQAPNKIDLLKSAMKLLVKQLRAQDRISIAVYAGSSGEVLAPTAGDEKAAIQAALDRLQAGGSTNGGAGIRLAYSLARQNFIADGVNRVILATDGDFNVGTTDIGELERLVEQERKSGVALTVLGFGTGNYNDHLMQKIAQVGNGNAAYIDSINEARKVLVDELGATLHTIAKDVKVQIEFNPAVVESYRLIGYETRHLNREDFNNDKVDAGEIGAGHTVTALYELTMVGGGSTLLDPLRYADPVPQEQVPATAEVAFLKLRHKAPDGDQSRLTRHALFVKDVVNDLDATSETYRFSAAVAWLGQLLRHDTRVGDGGIADVVKLAQAARGADAHGYRSEFINLARTAEALSMVSMNHTNLGSAAEQG